MKVVFVSTGDGKKDMIKNILKDKNEAYPAARVQPQPGELIWIIDKAAAAKLWNQFILIQLFHFSLIFFRLQLDKLSFVGSFFNFWLFR